MDWKQEAKKELGNYEYLKSSLPNIKNRIGSLEDRMTSLKSCSDDTPVQGGGNRYDDNIINCIVEKERLRYTYKANRTRLNLIERGLSMLSETERDVLTAFFINRQKRPIDYLIEKTNYEQAQIYRIRDAALYKFTIAQYGITEF